MIQRMSDERKISFVDPKVEVKETVQDQTPSKESFVDRKARRLMNKDDGMKTDKHICSARTGVILDDKGPNKYVKSDSSNTVWDPNKSGRESLKIVEENKAKEKQVEAEIVEKEKIKKEVEKEEKQDNTAFSRLSDFKGSSYHVPSAGMSIFDNTDFQRLTDKTAGENLSDEVAQKRSAKDESWKGNGKAVSSKDITASLFDRLFK